MARDLCQGDLVTHRSRCEDLFVVIGYTFRVNIHDTRRLIKLFCARTGRIESLLEEQLVIVRSVNKEEEQ